MKLARESAPRSQPEIDEIREFPEAWPFWGGRDEVRRRVLRNMPYSIVYVMSDGAIVILAIAHHKRRPGYWLRRAAP